MQFKAATDLIFKRLVKELPKQLFYHTINHVLDVYSAADMIGKAEGIAGDDMRLLLTAAAYHDAGFIKVVKGHEEESCRIARETLQKFGYSPADIETICGLIMTTQIPQSPKNHLEEILADADLDYLGRDDFWTTGDKLYQELLTAGMVKNEDDWNRVQVKFMESHHYFTKTSVNLRGAKKELHLTQVKAKLNN